ncbi:MAG: HD domain-containing protein [Lachnospiraceae bacterium]|nr:HD domain-containing protein [Lachnospiraceae bacterium]
MIYIPYGISMIISLLVIIYMAQKNYNNIDIYYWSLVVIIPIIELAYWLDAQATTVEASKNLFCFIYLDSTFFLTILIFLMMKALGFSIKPWMKILGYGAAAVHMGMVALCVHNDLYYKTVEVIDTGIGYTTKMTSGPLKVFHNAYLLTMFGVIIFIFIFAFIRKGTFSRRSLYMFLITVVVGLALHLYEEITSADFSMLPFLYTIGSLAIAFNYDYIHIHDISCLISEHQKYHSSRGYAAISLKADFLSCNPKCIEYLPFLKTQRVDEKLSQTDAYSLKIYELINSFENGGANSFKFQINDMTCVCEISHFSIRKDGKTQGYLLDIRDSTEEQKTYDIITSYNETLNAEVQEKTESIKDIQRKIVLGMANMIENRDNNTGGHVKRTSDIIHIIVDEIKKQDILPIDDVMANDIVRAAPTHDLGKITIDSSILLKPAALTDEEYTIMKTHAEKSGEMVLILLDGVEEKRFVDVAYNVARYHHERWDGRGYPEGLVGTMIPLEARIMAVADVYDALVSKRAYKEPLSYEKVASMMLEGMGTQFDPNLKSVFIGCRSELEKYYEHSDAR